MDATIEKIACPSLVSMKSLQTLDEISDIDDWLTMTISAPNVTGKYPALVYIFCCIMAL